MRKSKPFAEERHDPEASRIIARSLMRLLLAGNAHRHVGAVDREGGRYMEVVEVDGRSAIHDLRILYSGRSRADMDSLRGLMLDLAFHDGGVDKLKEIEVVFFDQLDTPDHLRELCDELGYHKEGEGRFVADLIPADLAAFSADVVKSVKRARAAALRRESR